MTRLFRLGESVISDLVHLLASMAVISCVFCQLATQSVETQLGKLAVGGITDQNKNEYSNTEHKHCKVEHLAVALFFGETNI